MKCSCTKWAEGIPVESRWLTKPSTPQVCPPHRPSETDRLNLFVGFCLSQTHLVLTVSLSQHGSSHKENALPLKWTPDNYLHKDEYHWDLRGIYQRKQIKQDELTKLCINVYIVLLHLGIIIPCSIFFPSLWRRTKAVLLTSSDKPRCQMSSGTGVYIITFVSCSFLPPYYGVPGQVWLACFNCPYINTKTMIITNFYLTPF